jgi:hypothetical protein
MMDSLATNIREQQRDKSRKPGTTRVTKKVNQTLLQRTTLGGNSSMAHVGSLAGWGHD